MKWLSLMVFVCSLNVFAAVSNQNFLDELDPRDPGTEALLQKIDEDYFNSTGESPFIGEGLQALDSCYRNACPIWARVNLAEQLMYVSIDGVVKYTWPVSSGKKGFSTPKMDRNPNGRIYDRYTSTQYPEGDYNGLGNMPYAVFIQGGYAIHGTTKGNWPSLGKAASHGCIRLHPDNALIFNRMVRSTGIGAVWVTVE